MGHGVDENGLDPAADTSPQVEEVPSPDDENVSRFLRRIYGRFRHCYIITV